MGKASRENRDHAAAATARLRQAGLRPTRQRVELAGLLFKDGDRHVTAESLHDEITTAGVKVSLATVYNTLHQFTEAGLLRQLIVDAARSYFDTNTGEHQHFFLEKEGLLIDIPGETIAVAGVPTPPSGLAVDRVDVVVRVKRN
ncbi:MAG TPA: Fur family transcriptional regulator [Rhizomicrobium sp.]|nr:Fur family transcriptional regulator [Rhizomicrobium sp.]